MPLLLPALIVFAASALAQRPDGPPPLDPGRPSGGRGPGGFGGPPGGVREEINLVKQFDKDGNKRLDATERRAAREFLAKERAEGRGQFRGPRRPPRDENAEPPKPGPRVTLADAKPFPGASLYASNVLRTFFLEFENADWEKELSDFHGTDVEDVINERHDMDATNETIQKILADGTPVELEFNIINRTYSEGRTAYNTVAEIPGTDKRGEVVMLGAHLDSWHAGTGATDNAAGSAVVMEAVRILQALEVKPRRTIRVALWSGEEEGLLGSRAYVTEHFGTRGGTPDPSERDLPSFLRRDSTGPVTTKPDHARLSAYFNVDNGTGKIRGIYAERNAAVAPLFEAWLRPLHDLGATTVTLRHTGGTDHLSFDGIGLPGFQFIQDEIEYDSRTHHSNQDVFDRIQADDMKQAATIMAAFIYNAAIRDEKVPRKPVAGR